MSNAYHHGLNVPFAIFTGVGGAYDLANQFTDNALSSP